MIALVVDLGFSAGSRVETSDKLVDSILQIPCHFSRFVFLLTTTNVEVEAPEP